MTNLGVLWQRLQHVVNHGTYHRGLAAVASSGRNLCVCVKRQGTGWT